MKSISLFTKSKWQFLLLLLLLVRGVAVAQTSVSRYAAHEYFDTLFDRFGKKYTTDELSIPTHRTPPPPSRHGAPSPSTSLYTLCTPGYFRIYLEAGCGMDHYASDPAELARLNVLCRVLTDISNFIPSPCTVTGQTVNIWVRAGLTTGLGVATPFFNIPYSTSRSGIVDNTAWLTINSGADAFAGIAFPVATSGGGSTGSGGGGSTYFHASIALNFSTITWYTDMSTAPASGESDLYTAALHEMMHALGFCSLLKYDGTSLFGSGWQYFSRFDTHLENNAATDHLIKTTSGCDMYQFAFNTAGGFSPPTTILSPGGCGSFFSGETNYTNCATAIKYVGGWSVPVPVYTPQCFEPGASLNHFEDECYVPSYFAMGPTAGTTTNDQYFLMSNSAPDLALGGYNATTNPGVMKRYPTPEERQALCDMGYKVNTTFGVPGVGGTYPLPSGPNLNYYDYGGAMCPGRQVVGFNDGLSGSTYTFFTAAPVAIDINAGASGGSFLSNDRVNGVPMTAAGGGSFTCLEVMTGTGSVSVSSGTFTTTVSYTPGVTDFGVELLRYIPVSPSGVEGNITYIYVFVGDASCLPSTCNMVMNGDFENATAGVCGFYVAGEHCWLRVNYNPFSLATDAPASADGIWDIPNYYWFQNGIVHPSSPASNHRYVNLYNGINSSGEWASGSIHERLTTNLINGQQYILSFWALRGGGATDACCFTNRQSHLQFYAGNAFPLVGTSWVAAGYSPPGFTLLFETQISGTGFPDYNWHYYSDTITYTGPDAGVLYIQPAPWDDTGMATTHVDSAKSIGLDDISIVPLSAACLFSIPGPVSACAVPFSLDTAASVCVPGGTFSWSTLPVTASGATTTYSSLFDPARAYAASLATGGTGVISVSYTYTVSGCPRTVTTTINVLSSSTVIPPIAGIARVCPGDSTALSDALAGGVWISTFPALATVNPATGMVYGISGGIDTIIYTVGCGSARLIVTVNPAPGGIIGIARLCVSASTTLLDFTPGGTWSSSNTAVITVGSSSGIATGVGLGTATIIYRLSTGCTAWLTITVDPTPTPITGLTILCPGDTTTLADTMSGGVWSSGSTAVATIGPSGLVLAVATGTATISYTATSACGPATIVVTVNPLLPPISGDTMLCAGATTTMTDAMAGGVWSSGSTAIATVDALSGIVSGITGGTATITYTVSTACASAILDITVNPSPAPISGATSLCMGDSAAMTDAVPGGTWGSSITAIATVDSTSGMVYAIAPGTATISYTLANGCGTASIDVTVNPVPSPVAGPTILCPGITVTMTDDTTGGTWSNSNATVATIGSSSGVVSALTTGMDTVRYTLSTGCFATTVITVSVFAGSLTGINTTTVGGTTTLTDIVTGGTWSSSNTGVATIGTSGIVTGASIGTTIITYTSPAGCRDTMLVKVTRSIVGVPAIPGSMQLSLIPNPNTGVFTLYGTMPGTGEVRIEIFDVLGKIIYTNVATTDRGLINKQIALRDNIPGGVYTLKVINNSGSKVLRFALER